MFLFEGKKKTAGLVGISVYHDSVAIAHIQHPEGEKPKLLSCMIKPHKNPKDPQETLTNLVSERNLRDTDCTLVLAPGDYQLIVQDAPDLKPEELRAAARWQINDLLNFPAKETVLDVFLIPPHGPGSRRKIMYVVASRMSRLQRLVDLTRNSGLRPSIIDIPELALRNIETLCNNAYKGDVALIQLTPHMAKAIVVRDNDIYLARNLIEDPQQILSARVEQQARFLHFEKEIVRSYEYYKQSQLGDNPPERMLLSTTEEELEEFLTSRLPSEILPLDMNVALNCSTELDPITQAICLPTIGAALRTEGDDYATN